MDRQKKAAVDGLFTRVMADRLVDAAVDLNDERAIRDALRTARFGEQLIENCAADAADRARLLRSH